MASVGQRLKVTHEKTDSEALEDLSSAFHDLDIDGEGLLDQASFLTALRMLGVTLPPSELEKIFEVLDEDDSGMIAYDKLKEFMKIGKIPSTILNKIKSTGNTKRASVIFGAGPMGINNTGSKTQTKYKGGGSLPILTESTEQKPSSNDTNQDDVKMDKNRVKMIQRAVIVIKKAAMKNISRGEVIEFLLDKGMIINDIELAYKKASEQVMSPDERTKYLSDLSQSRLNELNEQKKINDYVSQQMTIQSQEIQLLRELLKMSTDTLLNTFPNKTDEIVTKLAADELTNRIQQSTKDLKQAEEQKDDSGASVYRQDLKALQLISQCVTNKQHFHANLYFHQLEPVIRDSMPHLQGFLSDYDNPNGDQQDIDYDADNE